MRLTLFICDKCGKQRQDFDLTEITITLDKTLPKRNFDLCIKCCRELLDSMDSMKSKSSQEFEAIQERLG